ncbi:PEGA domain-containing protein [Halopiger xanaduensis]|uniref:PEGA domain protein n=1 Tax=Halopiger xanaduensis (strain DSM 18323 / JCM 14033 / SH-6) TaxID=797210 RepID=F8DDF6_HALXS|nr:PEGA domain-containing protein [Halopiger xanaduensis]AEH39050.1 PEGA domain protein [Halopiger xanaduensis SH-6]
MVRSESLTRRQVASLLVTGSVGAIAGCASTGDDDGADAETSNDTDGSNDSDPNLREAETDLTIRIEDENGDPVSSENATVEIVDHATDIEYTIEQEIEDGVAEPQFIEATTYTVTIVSEEYEDAEQEISLEAGDEEELSFELEAAS